MLRSKITQILQGFKVRSKLPDDPNFIGFDKYRKHGAYHWREMEESKDYQGKIDALRPLVGPADTCLDIGCGDGAYVYEISKQAREVVGIDADADAIRLAKRELARRNAANARCYQMPISGLSLTAVAAEQPFDVVYSMDVIEHLPRPEELLEAAVDVLKEGGLVAIGTPLYLSDALVSPYHVKEFRREEIRALLDRFVAVEQDVLLPMRRSDGVLHPDSFYVGVGRARL